MPVEFLVPLRRNLSQPHSFLRLHYRRTLTETRWRTSSSCACMCLHARQGHVGVSLRLSMLPHPVASAGGSVLITRARAASESLESRYQGSPFLWMLTPAILLTSWGLRPVQLIIFGTGVQISDELLEYIVFTSKLHSSEVECARGHKLVHVMEFPLLVLMSARGGLRESETSDVGRSIKGPWRHKLYTLLRHQT